jgi:hypothetical protein
VVTHHVEELVFPVGEEGTHGRLLAGGDARVEITDQKGVHLKERWNKFSVKTSRCPYRAFGRHLRVQ